MSDKDGSRPARGAMFVQVRVAWLARLAITAALLIWVFSRDDVRSGLRTARYVHPWWLLGAVVAGGVAALCAAWRWHLCLRACDCALPFRTVLRLSLASHAAGLFSIGPLGVDAVRVALAGRRLPKHHGKLLASVTLDHVSAMPAFLLLGVALIALLGLSAELNRSALRALGLGAAACAGVALCLRVMFPAWHRRAIGYATQRLRAPGTAVAVMVSLPLLVSHYAVFWCAAQALAVPAPSSGLFGAIVVADTIAALPITIAGLGFREKSFEVLLSQWYGVASALSVKASLTGLAVLVLWAIVGVIGLPLRDMREHPSS